MTIDQLNYFVNIYEQGSFSVAAEYLSISQSALSKQIKSLEDELDVSLFDTTNKRNVKVTSAGEEFYSHARRLLTQYNDMKNSLEPYRER